jgi:hypothetical protein
MTEQGLGNILGELKKSSGHSAPELSERIIFFFFAHAIIS